LSRNRDRLGPSTPQAANPAPQATQQASDGSGFSFVVPTEFVELPSKGRFYPESHPLHKQDTIEIKQMTAKEEDLLTSRALLKKGVALDRVIESLILNKSINPNSLLVGDRNAIMIAARISGYGSEYNTSITCPSCAAVQKYSFNLVDSTLQHGEIEDALTTTEVGGGLFTTVLPRTKFEVTFRILNGSDEKVLVKQIENARKKNREENAVTRQLRLIVVAVNGDETPQAIEHFVSNMPSLDAQHLRTAFAAATPNVDLTQFFTCEQCDFETDLEVPLTADFFWPNR
jgi:hypothetical protein